MKALTYIAAALSLFATILLAAGVAIEKSASSAIFYSFFGVGNAVYFVINLVCLIKDSK